MGGQERTIAWMQGDYRPLYRILSVCMVECADNGKQMEIEESELLLYNTCCRYENLETLLFI